jgi:ABC-type lipoprotein export system ATPase subunit
MPSPKPAPPRTVIHLDGVGRRYLKPDGTVLVDALQNVDLTIEAGEYVAIMGASGSGKSTMMNLIGCLDRPTSGHCTIDGEEIADLDDTALSQLRGRTIGFIFQAFNLISALTIVENVEVPLFYQGIPGPQRREQAIAMLDRVGLADRLTHRPAELSGGQQQRVAAARALVTAPTVLLADEPTGNLDSTTGTAILDLLSDLHDGGLTILMVTHDSAVAARCQRLIELTDGRVVTDRATTASSYGTHSRH